MIENTANIICLERYGKNLSDCLDNSEDKHFCLRTAKLIFNQPSGLPCPECENGEVWENHGSNGYQREPCPACNGTGKRTVLQALELLEKGERE